MSTTLVDLDLPAHSYLSNLTHFKFMIPFQQKIFSYLLNLKLFSQPFYTPPDIKKQKSERKNRHVDKTVSHVKFMWFTSKNICHFHFIRNTFSLHFSSFKPPKENVLLDIHSTYRCNPNPPTNRVGSWRKLRY